MRRIFIYFLTFLILCSCTLICAFADETKYAEVEITAAASYLVTEDGRVEVVTNYMPNLYDKVKKLTDVERVIPLYLESSPSSDIDVDGLVFKKDGTVVNFDGKPIEGWDHIIDGAVTAHSNFGKTDHYYYGVTADGKVVTTSTNEDIINALSQWRDIAGIRIGYFDNVLTIVGIRTDGTVVSYPEHEEIIGCNNLTDIAIMSSCFIGLQADGTIILSSSRYAEFADCTNVEKIVTLPTRNATGFVILLHRDGTISSNYRWDGGDSEINRNFNSHMEWTNIRDIAIGKSHITAVTKDGNVICVSGRESQHPNIISDTTHRANYTESACLDIAKKRLKNNLKYPMSLQIHSCSTKDDKDNNAYRFTIDYSAQNGLGGYMRNYAFISVEKATGDVIKMSFSQ